MKMFVVAVGLFAVALAAPSLIPTEAERRRALPALHHEEVHDPFGQYALRYVTAEGTVVSERGHLVPTPDGKGHVMVIDGETTFIGTDGKTYITKYHAGLDGAHADGEHLPKAPEPEPSK